MKPIRRSLADRFPVLAVAFLVGFPVGMGAQIYNASEVTVPTLDGIGLASLAGVVTMTGAWLLAHRRTKKN